MTNKEIDALGPAVYAQRLTIVDKPRQSRRELILGFDTEYDSATRELLSVQLSYNGEGDLYEIPRGRLLDWETLEFFVLDFCAQRDINVGWRDVRAVKLVCFFSLGEAQHIQNLTQARVFETSVGVDYCWQGRGGRTFEIVDAMKFFNNPPQPLRKVAASFGFEKLEYDTSKVSRSDLKNPDFVKYAIHDAVIVEQVFRALRQRNLDDFGVDIVLTKTPAQTSAMIFRSHYLDEEIYCPSQAIRRLAMRCAWGGRNEAYARGTFEGEIHEYDAFSEYPNSAVQLGRMPLASDWKRSESLADLRYNGVGAFRFYYPKDIVYPCLPAFENPRLYYTRNGITYSTYAEARFALEQGAGLRLIEGYHYDGGTESLADFMRDMLERRQKAKDKKDSVGSHVLKLAINSLIGKFLQRVDKTDLNTIIALSDKLGIPITELKTMDAESLEQLANSFGLEPVRRVSLGSAFVPEWNALVLGYARASTSRFLDYLNGIGMQPLVASTDSVLFRGSYTELNKEVNGIRFESRAVGDLMQVVRTRLYRVSAGGDTVKMAHHAVPGRAIAETLFEQWAQGNREAITYPYRRLVKFRESLSSGRAFGSDCVQPIRRTRLGWDNKRVLTGPEPTPTLPHLQVPCQ